MSGQHELTVLVPKEVSYERALLLITGGKGVKEGMPKLVLL